MAHPGGRPTKYKPEYCDELVKFFSIPPFYEREIEHYDKKGNLAWTDYKTVPNILPTFLHFAMKIGVNQTTIVEWAEKFPEFSIAYIQAKELQKQFLIENGTRGIYNAAFTIFVAKNITDMRDKTEVEHSGNLSLTHLLDAAAAKRPELPAPSPTDNQLAGPTG